MRRSPVPVFLTTTKLTGACDYRLPRAAVQGHEGDRYLNSVMDGREEPILGLGVRRSRWSSCPPWHPWYHPTSRQAKVCHRFYLAQAKQKLTSVRVVGNWATCHSFRSTGDDL